MYVNSGINSSKPGVPRYPGWEPLLQVVQIWVRFTKCCSSVFFSQVTTWNVRLSHFLVRKYFYYWDPPSLVQGKTFFSSWKDFNSSLLVKMFSQIILRVRAQKLVHANMHTHTHTRARVHVLTRTQKHTYTNGFIPHARNRPRHRRF